MAKDKLTEYDATANNNTVVGDVNLAENSMNPSDVNNAIREVMSHQKEAFGSGTPLYVDQTNNRVGVNNSSPTVALDVSGQAIITTTDNSATLTLTSTDADANIAPILNLKRDSSSPADGDVTGQIKFVADNDTGEEITFAEMKVHLTDVSDGTEDGEINIKSFTNGTSNNRLQIGATETVLNQDSADLDFRVESNGNANMLFVQGSSDNIAIGHSAPTFATGNGVHLGDDHFLGFGVGNGTRPDFQIGQVSGTNTLGIRCGTGADTADITIDTTGRFLMGTTSAFTACSFGSVFDGTNFNAIVLKTTRTTNTGSNFLVFLNSDGDNCGFVQQNGTTSTNFSTSSDYRLKENVTYDFDATTRLKQLKPARFNFIADGTDRIVDGFLAHEVSSIVPEAIIGEKDAMTKEVFYVEDDEIPEGKKVGDVKEASKIDPQAIDQSKLVPLLTKTILELEARITALESA
jgi:hypothetical protein